MKRHRLVLIFSAALAALLPLQAVAERVQTARPGPDAAQVSGIPGYPTRDIFEVRIVAINDHEILPRELIWLEPGTYRIRVAIDARSPRPGIRRPTQRQPGEAPEYTEIELELEAGKTYQIRGRLNREDRETPYSVILYKVE
jgi:hypothetical protein